MKYFFGACDDCSTYKCVLPDFLAIVERRRHRNGRRVAERTTGVALWFTGQLLFTSGPRFFCSPFDIMLPSVPVHRCALSYNTYRLRPKCISFRIQWHVALPVLRSLRTSSVGPGARCQRPPFVSFSLPFQCLRCLWQKAILFILPRGQLQSDAKRLQIAHICLNLFAPSFC